ncbi:MAG: OmpA family protein [Urechidicola sp.]|nr:OmpA family protein [Urechidicola sp.]
MKKIILILCIAFICPQLMVAQSLKRADKLFEKRAYIIAAEIYLEEDDKTTEILGKLGDCYYYNSNMKEATKWYRLLIKEQSKMGALDYDFVFKYAQALKGIKNYPDADKWMNVYNEKKGVTKIKTISTQQFIINLNEANDRPFIVHQFSSNSEFSDFGVSHNGNIVVFASSRGDGNTYDWNNQAYLDLYQGIANEEGDVSNISSFGEEINTKMHESNAVFTKDGTTMYFTRNSFISGKKQQDDNKITNLKIYKAELIDNKWSSITELPFNSNSYSVAHPALSEDEKQLYFASDMPGTLGLFDIFVVEILEDGYGTPKNLGATINTIHREQFPYISSNNTLYFASDGHFGLGGLDIFKSEFDGANFSIPVNMSDKINSNLDDFAFVIDEEKEVGYFSSNRDGGLGDDDIYRFTREKKFYVTGVVKDKNSLELLPGTLVTLFDDQHNSIADMIVTQDAKYSFEIKNNSNYVIRGTRKLYIPNNVEFSTNNEGDINKEILLELESYEDAEKNIVVENDKTQIKINPIYFDFDKWNIRPDAANELDNVVAMMKKYPDMVIEIGAHTDARGSENYNLKLSHKRAASVREHLVSQGISNDNVKSVGYGEMQPLNNCTEEGICEEEEYDINRRCEFVILN